MSTWLQPDAVGTWSAQPFLTAHDTKLKPLKRLDLSRPKSTGLKSGVTERLRPDEHGSRFQM